MVCLAHDLLQISGLSDLLSSDGQMTSDLAQALCPLWVERSLQEAAFVVVRRANSFEGMVPVGVRGSLRTQRFAAYIAPESIRKRITPEQIMATRAWLIDDDQMNGRAKEIPAIDALVAIEDRLGSFPFAYGPTGSVGFELASGIPTATSTSDLDLLIRAPEHFPMPLAQEIMTIFSHLRCRVDAQLETPRGAISLAEYARGETPLLSRQSSGPALVSDPWQPPTA
jgi:phosphoribosyl-dephospho-CoA transferase